MSASVDNLLSHIAFTPYTFVFLGGILITAAMWWRLLRNPAHRDARLGMVYFCGLWGALVGAKVAFLLAEGWNYREDMLALLSGKSITGGLIGGYVAVEVGKKIVGYARATGDLFAITVPLGIGLGRVGCLLQGCCAGKACEPAWWTTVDAAGVHRWPSQASEIAFHMTMLGWAVLAGRLGWLPQNRFHVYLIAYGVFRFASEFLRDERRMLGPLTGYHFIALAIALLGSVRLIQRLREPLPSGDTPGVSLGNGGSLNGADHQR